MNSNAVPDDPAIQGAGSYGQVTLEQQARYAALAYQRVMEEWPWTGVVNFWFFKQASDARKGEAMYYFRMVEPDFTPMPVYDAMRGYATDLTPALYPGYHQEDHWALAYSGEWETVDDPAAVLGAYRRATSPGATVDFEFDGASLTLVPGPGTGVIEVSVDGGVPDAVTLTGGPVRIAEHGYHSVTLTVKSGTVAVDGLVVQRIWQPSPWSVLGVIGLLAVALWIALRVLRRR
jgi:hypothetical protein